MDEVELVVMAELEVEISVYYILYDSVIFRLTTYRLNDEVIPIIVPVVFIGDGTVPPESDLVID